MFNNPIFNLLDKQLTEAEARLDKRLDKIHAADVETDDDMARCGKCGETVLTKTDRCGELCIGGKGIVHCRENCEHRVNHHVPCRYCGHAPLPVNGNTDNDCVILDNVAICKVCSKSAIWNDNLGIWHCPEHFTGMEE